MMNIGMDNSAKLSSLPKKISGNNSSDRIPSKASRKPAEITNRPLATEIPENNTAIVTKATSSPRTRGSISCVLSVQGYHRLQREPHRGRSAVGRERPQSPQAKPGKESRAAPPI